MTPELKQQFQTLGFTNAAMAKLERYAALITQWNKAINLVAPSTLPHLWERHLLDSAQLWPIIHESDDTTLVDLGSGGGLPALVLAMAGAKHVTMVESDTRKCVFLREVSRETNLTNVTIINERIEKTQGIESPIITARALASLAQLVEWSLPLLKPNGKMVFLKGADVEQEISALPLEYQGKITLKQSVTASDARIVTITL